MRVSAPPCRACQSRSRASPSVVTTLATSRPPGGRLAHACDSKPAAPMPPPTKIASRRRQAVERLGCRAEHDAQLRDAERGGVARDHRGARRIALDRDGRAALAVAQPFDRDRAATGADIPQGFAGQWGERREGRGAHLALGQLAVMLEDVVGKPGEPRQCSGAAAGAAIDRDRVEVGNPPIAPACASSAMIGFSAAAEMGEHGEPARPPAEPGQQLGDRAAACRRPPTGPGCGDAARDVAARCRAAGRAG